MKDRAPEGLTPDKWGAVINGLESRRTTVNDYRKVLNLLHAYNDSSFNIETLTKEQAVEYFNYLDGRLKNGTLSDNTVHRYKATLRSIGARMEKRNDVWPGYVNPFSGLVTNENRQRTVFNESLFPLPEDIEKIREAVKSMSNEEQIIIALMMNVGLTPAQIQNLRVSDFSNSSSRPSCLICEIDEGTFIEKTSDPWKESKYYKEGYPVHYVRKSPSRSITWNYTGSYAFSPEFSEVLRGFNEYVGVSTDTRPFFLTARHLEFNYRAMHHMVLTVCHHADIPSGRLTPNMISRYGLVLSYLQHKHLAMRAELSAMKEEAPEAERSAIEKQISANEEILTKLTEKGMIGQWQDRFPIPLQERINSIIGYLGEDFLLKAIGI